MTDLMSVKLGMERCLTCDHRWIDYEKARPSCYMCGGTKISECVSLKEIREAIAALRKEDKKYLDKHAKRTIILKQRYREIAELSLRRAQEVYAKVKEHYTGGDLSDKVVEQLIVAFRLFSDLGLHKSAGAIAYMAAMGYAQRGIEKEIREAGDLDDLVAARQWFIRLGSKEWEAAINLHIGEKAMSAVSTDQTFLQLATQVSLWHFYRARDYYYEQRNPKMVERIQFDIERSSQLLGSYTHGASQVEAAKIAAQSAVAHGEHVRRGLESLGQSVHQGLSTLGEWVDHSSGRLSRAVQMSSAALSANVTNAMYTVASSKQRGRSLDRRMSEVGQLISTTSHELPEDFFRPVGELGARFALGAVGAATRGDITREPEVINLAESVLPESRKGAEPPKPGDESSIALTGTLLDALVTKGFARAAEKAESGSPRRKSD